MNVETKPGMLWIDRMGDRRSWAILVRFFSVENWGQAQRKKKGAKKKENGGLWKLTPLTEIRSQRGFPQRLGKHKTLSTVPTRPDGGSKDLIQIHQQGGAKSNDQKGPNQVDGRIDTADFVRECRNLQMTPHVAQNLGRRGGSAIDRRTTRHVGYRISQKKRKRIEECFGWLKTIALLRQVRHRGTLKVDWTFTFACAAYNLVRMRNLMAAAVVAQ